MFTVHGVPVHDSDATVHKLYEGRAVPLVEAQFPGVSVDGKIDRKALSAKVLGNPEALKQLEAIVHPLVHEEEERFLADARRRGALLVVIDSPLLLETVTAKRCDAVLVVTAPFEVQKARVLARPGMTEEAFERIHVKQMPDSEKRHRAHFIVDTGRGMEAAQRQVDDIVRALAGRYGSISRQISHNHH